MKICNVHQRSLEADQGTVGRLLDTLAGPEDRLWPTGRWPAIRFDRGLVEGAVGGHGPIPYRVAAYRPGRHLEFEFLKHPGLTAGLSGRHWFEVVAEAAGRTLLRHVVAGEARRSALWRWPLVLRPLHDALMEDLLDRAQQQLGGEPPQPARWSLWVRGLRWALARRRRR